MEPALTKKKLHLLKRWMCQGICELTSKSSLRSMPMFSHIPRSSVPTYSFIQSVFSKHLIFANKDLRLEVDVEIEGPG